MSKDEQESSHGSDNKIPSTLGGWLRQTREDSGFTVDEVARELKLAGSTVQDLEKDRTDHIGAPIYYKGFVRSYAKLLELPDDLVEQRLGELINVEPMPRVPEGTIRVRRSRWMERYTLMASYVVGTALVLPLLYWLVSSDGAPRILSDQDSQDVSLPVPSPSDASQIATNADAQATDAQTPALSGDSAPVAAALSNPTEEMSAPVTASLTPFGLGRGAASAPSSDQLTLELDQASWVSLTDGNGDRVVYRTLDAGKHQLSGAPPLRLRLGNVTDSRLFIAGQAVDLQAYERGNVANLTLSNNAQGKLQANPVESR